MAPPAPAEGSCLHPPGPGPRLSALPRPAPAQGCSGFVSLACEHRPSLPASAGAPGQSSVLATSDVLPRLSVATPAPPEKKARKEGLSPSDRQEGGQLNSRESGELFPPLQVRSTEKYAAVYLSSWVSHPLLRGSPAGSLTGWSQCLGMRFERLLISLRGQTSQLRQCPPAPPAQQVREPLSSCENIRGLPSETFCHPLPFPLGRHPVAAAVEIRTDRGKGQNRYF